MAPEDQTESSLHFLDYWRVIRSRKEIVLAVILLVVVTGISYTMTLPRIYMANARISLREDATDIDVFHSQYVSAYNPFFLKTQYEIIQSRPIINEVIRELDLARRWGQQEDPNGAPLSPEDAYLTLARSMRVNQYRDTSLIDIQVYRENPAEAADIANRIAEIYLRKRLDQKRAELKRAVDVLEQQKTEQEELVRLAEDRLQKIREEVGLSTIAKNITPDKQRIAALEAERISARVDMETRRARRDQVTPLSGEELFNTVLYIINDQSLVMLHKQLVDAEVTMSSLMVNYAEEHPQVKQVRAAIDELRTRLDNALAGVKRGVQADFEVAKARYETLERDLEAAKAADITETGAKMLPYERAEREVETQRDLLAALRAKVKQERITMEVPRTPGEVVEKAEPPPVNRPVSPNFLLNILLSIVLGVAAGVGLAYFIEYLDTSVKTVDDVERHLGLPVLGVIPQKVRPLTEEGSDSPHAEAYRVLRTNMQFTNKNRHGGAFAVVSGGVGEGKSTTLFNLAYVCAQLGDKVLVVDSDLRRPVQHTFLGLSNRFGLTNVLMRDVPVDEVIKPTNVPNLHFLPSGKLPRAALGLLDSMRMRELVKSLKARYDYVFFDSPPIVGVSDASILASEVDGVLLVVQYRKYPRSISSRARRMLENVGTNLLGVVLNNINILRDDYYYYYHSYYSHSNQPDESEGGPSAESGGKPEVL